MLHANLGPANPRTMQRYNCIQQALEAAGVCKIVKEHAREKEGERGEEELDCVGRPVAKKQHIKSFSIGPA